jgi:hypothetical protein
VPRRKSTALDKRTRAYPERTPSDNEEESNGWRSSICFLGWLPNQLAEPGPPVWMELPASTELFNSLETQTITPVNVLGRRFVIASFEHLCDNAVHSLEYIEAH